MAMFKWFNNYILSCFSLNFPCFETNDEHYNDFYLPDDVLIEILIRVSVDRLQVLKRVCHHWRVLISSHEFLKLQIKRARDEKFVKKVMFVEYTQYSPMLKGPKLGFWLGDGKSQGKLINLEGIKRRCDDGTIRVVGSCDGLLMFHVQPGWRSLIINPSTRESRIITSPNEKGNAYACCMFFDRFEDDYKLLHISSKRTNIRPSDCIYSFNAGEWERLESVQTHHRIMPRLGDPPVIVNESLHWIGYPNFRCSKMVLVFKIETKNFTFIPYPSVINTKLYLEAKCCLSWGPYDNPYPPHPHDSDESMRLIEKDGILGLCHTIGNLKVIDMWFLMCYEDLGSWAKMFKVDLSHVGINVTPNIFWYGKRNLKSIKIVSFNDDDILIAWPNAGLYLYNLKTKMIKVIELSELPLTLVRSSGPYNCIPLTKTLLSPNVYTTL